MPLSGHAKDLYVAPKMSQFTTADIVDMSNFDKEQQHWVANYILNSMFGSGGVTQPARQRVFHFLRRAEAAFAAHGEARELTIAYLRNKENLTAYLGGVSHWESFFSHAYIAFEQLRHMSKSPLFERGDGSVLQRLNMLYNISKHANETQFPQDGTLPIWLENDGLHCTEAHLTFEELSSDVLPELARWADILGDPAQTRAKLERRVAEQEAAAQSTAES